MGSWQHTVLGMMSGTSLDGLDLAMCRIGWDGARWEASILAAETVAYTDTWKKALSGSMKLDGVHLALLSVRLGHYMGTCAADFIVRTGIRPDFLSSHGHTVFHRPEEGMTLQIGSGAHMAAVSGFPVVCDFRTLDVALGGQGAPLVPVGDKLLFGHYDFCLNLGGIANISYELGTERQAFDICPVNMALDLIARHFGREYDEGGAMAASGTPDPRLLDQLDQLRFYSMSPPKTLGREWFDLHFLPLLQASALSGPDLMATVSEHIAGQIGRVLDGWNGSVLVTGGGAWNTHLIQRIQALSSAQVIIPDAQIVNFKEALVFALLGVLRWNLLANTMDSVTGASHAASSGVVWMPAAASKA